MMAETQAEASIQRRGGCNQLLTTALMVAVVANFIGYTSTKYCKTMGRKCSMKNADAAKCMTECELGRDDWHGALWAEARVP